MPLPLGQEHVKAEREGVEPGTVRSMVRLIARPASNGVPSPVGLPFRFPQRLRWQESNLRRDA